MKAVYQATVPAATEFTLKITATAYDFERLHKALEPLDNSCAQLWNFRNVLADVLLKARETFEAEHVSK